LTGYSLSLVKEGGEDIDLSEFKEEFGVELYNKMLDAGVETAREFLDTDVEKLLTIEGMTKELLIELRQIILTEFDEEESDEILDRIDGFDFDQDSIR